MKNMILNIRRFTVLLALCSGAYVLSSCDEDTDISPESTTITTEDLLTVEESVSLSINSEVAADDVYEDIDEIAEEAVETIVFSNARKGFKNCGTKETEEDTVNNITTTTITFDGTCDTGKRVRKGTIVIVRTGKRNEPGAKHTMTFKDFYVDSVKVEGTRIYENLTAEDSSAVKTIRITLEGGQLTFADESFTTRAGTNTRVFDKEAQTVTVTGEASGVNREGIAYNTTITTPIVFNRTCELSRIPVEGVKTMTTDSTSIVKNYGDGTCDNLVDVTTDGVTETVEVESRKKYPKAKALYIKRRGRR